VFEDIKTTDVEWLNDIRRIYKEVDGDNVLLFVKLFELSRKIVFVAVENDYTISAYPPVVYILVEMLYLF